MPTVEASWQYSQGRCRDPSFQRSFPIPAAVDSDKIEASFAKGLLTVKLPKSTEAKKAKRKSQSNQLDPGVNITRRASEERRAGQFETGTD